MISMRQLRSDPYYAPLFRHVHPLCWPILWWSLNRFFKWYDTSGYDTLLLATTRWGYVYPAWLGQKKPDPASYKPYKLEKPRRDDPVWSMSTPAALAGIAAREAFAMISHPPLRSGGGGSRQSRETEGACALAPHNTS
jgi:hypothetical protein